MVPHKHFVFSLLLFLNFSSFSSLSSLSYVLLQYCTFLLHIPAVLPLGQLSLSHNLPPALLRQQVTNTKHLFIPLDRYSFYSRIILTAAYKFLVNRSRFFELNVSCISSSNFENANWYTCARPCGACDNTCCLYCRK